MPRFVCYLVLALAPVFALADETYTIELLKPPQRYKSSYAMSLNDHGEVVGNVLWPSDWRGVLWKEGNVFELGTLGGPSSFAIAINNAGKIVGYADIFLTYLDNWYVNHAFIGDQKQLRDITFGSLTDSYSRDINNHGTVFGIDERGLFTWRNSNLSRPKVFKHAWPIAINDNEQLLAELEGWPRRYILSQGDDVREIRLDRSDWFAPAALNNLGQVVGRCNLAPGDAAFVWDDGHVTYMPINDRDKYIYPKDINDAGSIVGWVQQSWTDVRHAVIRQDDEWVDLNSLVSLPPNWRLETAMDINEVGQIVGTGTFDGKTLGFLLTPKSGYDIVMRLDADRDRSIDFDGDSDFTSWADPFSFWVNLDQDRYDQEEDEEDDLDPKEGTADAWDRVINSRRDLEDFARLQIRLPEIELDETWSVGLQFDDVAEGQPAINVWKAVDPELGYLEDEAMATDQAAVVDPLGVGHKLETVLPLELFQNEDRLACLLFEGRTEGVGKLVVRLRRNGHVLGEDVLHLQLRPITSFYDHWTAGDTANMDVGVIPDYPTTVQMADVDLGGEGYILFIHGWRMLPWERRAFAETAYKRLWHRGYRGGFGLFSWPTEWHAGRKRDHLGDPRHYNRSERKAYASAAALREVLLLLNNAHQGAVRVLAHSMGNVVASEALLLEAGASDPRRIVHTYIASQAASVASSYDARVPHVRRSRVPNVYGWYPITNMPYYYDISKVATVIINYYNRNDYALAGRLGWPTNQQTKPDMRYGYNKRIGYHRKRVGLIFPRDRAEIFAHVAPALSRALGAEAGAGGAVTRSVDLEASPFSLGANPQDHSAQFRSFCAKRWQYWESVMTNSGI